MLVSTTKDIVRAKEEAKLALYLQFQGTEELGYDPELIEVFHRLGVRVMGIAYNRRNPMGDGCEEPKDGGLTRLGAKAISVMNRTGVTVDVSHTGWKTSMDVIEESNQPVVATHSNATGVHFHPRNLPDEVITGISESQGVIGINAYPAFISSSEHPTIDEMIDHAVYIADLVGDTKILGLGLDYCEMDIEEYEKKLSSGLWNEKDYHKPPFEYPSPIRTAHTVDELGTRLIERGFNEAETRGILGNNWMRLFEEDWEKS